MTDAPLIAGRPPIRLGEADWIRRRRPAPTCETCHQPGELVGEVVLCVACAEGGA